MEAASLRGAWGCPEVAVLSAYELFPSFAYIKMGEKTVLGTWAMAIGVGDRALQKLAFG